MSEEKNIKKTDKPTENCNQAACIDAMTYSPDRHQKLSNAM
jgi:hypothetical protein